MEPSSLQLIRAGRVNDVEQLLDDEVPNGERFLLHMDSYLHEFIGLAARQGGIGILKRCLNYGVEVKIGRVYGLHALVGAASQGHDHIVQWLLEPWAKSGRIVAGVKHSAKVTLPEDWLCVPLHVAIHRQHVSTVKLLVDDAWAKVNARDKYKRRPLHVAAINVDKDNPDQMSRYEEIVEILLAADALPDDINPLTGKPPLYDAVIRNSRRATTKLLDNRVDVFRKVNGCNQTVLHIAAMEGLNEMLSTILEHDRFRDMGPDEFDIPDQRERTPLFLAASHGNAECIRILMKKGLNLASHTDNLGDVTPLQNIFKNVQRPVEFLTEIFDEQISTTDDTGQNVILDFKILTSNRIHEGKGYACYIRDVEVILDLIGAVQNIEQMAILQHPLLETFLHISYLRSLPHDVLFILISFAYAITLSWHVGQLFSANNPRDRDNILPILACLSLAMIMDYLQRILLAIMTPAAGKVWRALPMIPFLMGVTFQAMYLDELRYAHLNKVGPFSGVRQASSIAVLLAWIHVMIVFTRFPFTGEYAQMFFAVLINVAKVLLLFACPIIGFAFSFSLLFSSNEQFSDPWKALAKTLVMMTGEYDYGSLFTQTDQDNSTASSNSTSIDKGIATSQTLGTIIVLIFVIIIGIALMNLMLGLAVTNIQELMKVCHRRRLINQADSATVAFYCPFTLISDEKELDLKNSFCYGIPTRLKKSLSNLALKNFNRIQRLKTNPSGENRDDKLTEIAKQLQRLNATVQLMIKNREEDRRETVNRLSASSSRT